MGGFNHKMKSGIYASLDIGTTSIKVIVAEVLNGQINVIGVGNERSNGLSRGMIVDIDQTAVSIQQAVRQAEDKADIKINELIVGIPATICILVLVTAVYLLIKTIKKLQTKM